MDMYNFLKFACRTWSVRQPQTVTAIPWEHFTADRMDPGLCCLFQLETIIRSIVFPCVKCSHLYMRCRAQSHYVSILVPLTPQQILNFSWSSEQNMNKNIKLFYFIKFKTIINYSGIHNKINIYYKWQVYANKIGLMYLGTNQNVCDSRMFCVLVFKCIK